MTQTVVAPTEEATYDDDLIHLFCGCDEDMSLCGLDITDHTEVGMWWEEDRDCVVCLEFAKLPCERCGDVL